MATNDMQAVEEVIKKWQAHADPRPSSSGGDYGANDTINHGRKAWQEKFGDNLQAPHRQPSRYRPKKRKSKVHVATT